MYTLGCLEKKFAGRPSAFKIKIKKKNSEFSDFHLEIFDGTVVKDPEV